MTKQYTQQEVFDKVWDHFVFQGNEVAFYQGMGHYEVYDGGPRCAVGLFLDPIMPALRRDKDIHSMTTDVVKLFKTFSLEECGLDSVGLEFLEDLQRAHDVSEDDPIEPALRHLASLYNLKVPA
jgi:hypothetical protein